MSEIKWIKLSVNIFEDEKIRLIEGMPEGDSILLIWIKLLALAGKCNDDGLVYLAENIPYTDEMLATIFRKPIAIIRMALKTFESFQMIGITEQKSIEITNWNKHQNIEGMDRIRERDRLRKREARAKKKLLELPEPEEFKENCPRTSQDMSADVLTQNKNKNKNKNINTISSISENAQEENNKTYYDFEEIWDYIPKKKGKQPSRNKYKILLKQFTHDEILNAVKLFAEEMKKRDYQYVPYASTFFNQFIEDYINQSKNVEKQEKSKEIPNVNTSKGIPEEMNRHKDLLETAKKRAEEKYGKGTDL